MNSTGDVETLRMAVATASAEETVEKLSSESELGLALMVWRKQEREELGLRGRGIRSELEKNRFGLEVEKVWVRVGGGGGGGV